MAAATAFVPGIVRNRTSIFMNYRKQARIERGLSLCCFFFILFFIFNFLKKLSHVLPTPPQTTEGAVR